jgi:hypothetical protein
MWEWSWLSQHAPGGPFADWPAVCAQARERGFDAIRFDPVPDLVSAGRIRILANDVAVPWLHVPVETEVEPLAAVVEFACAARGAGLQLIPSSWGLNRGHQDGVVDLSSYPAFNRIEDDDEAIARYLDGWHEVLDALIGAGLADCLQYVDLLNEADLVAALSSSALRAADAQAPRADDPWAWSPAHGQAFRSFAERLVRDVHEHYPRLRATVSLCGPLDVVAPWLPRNLDVLEWHAWYSEPDRPTWSERVAYAHDYRLPCAQDFQTPEGRRRVDEAYRTAHAVADPVLRHQQDRYLGRIKELAEQRGLPAYLGEGYATPFWSDEPELSWDWVKDVSAASVRTVQQLGFEGYTTSNFSEPSFPLWDDVAWHRELLGGN